MSGGNVHSASLQRVEGSPLVKLAIILLYFAVVIQSQIVSGLLMRDHLLLAS